MSRGSSVTLTPRLLCATMPTLTLGRAESWAPLLTSAAEEFGITPPAHVAMWLAQAAHESGELRRLVESLDYRAERMIQVWPARFGHGPLATEETRARGRTLAASLAHLPEALAEHVYGGRMGNRPQGSGDGWRFRGRGIFMLTGAAVYRRAELALRLPLIDRPDLAAEPERAARIAGWFWRDRRLARYAEDLKACTRALNGGTTGLAERGRYWRRCRAALGLPAESAA